MLLNWDLVTFNVENQTDSFFILQVLTVLLFVTDWRLLDFFTLTCIRFTNSMLLTLHSQLNCTFLHSYIDINFCSFNQYYTVLTQCQFDIASGCILIEYLNFLFLWIKEQWRVEDPGKKLEGWENIVYEWIIVTHVSGVVFNDLSDEIVSECIEQEMVEILTIFIFWIFEWRAAKMRVFKDNNKRYECSCLIKDVK